MRDIQGYEGHYAVTSCGRVWSYKSKKFLKPSVDKDGYYRVTLSKDGKQQYFLVHRLVALVYILNPWDLPEVNHKNEIKNANWYRNLEWCDHEYNINYGTCPERISKALQGVSKGGKAIYCPELNESFLSVSEASERYGLCQGDISKCISGKRKHCGRHPITGEQLSWRLVS